MGCSDTSCVCESHLSQQIGNENVSVVAMWMFKEPIQKYVAIFFYPSKFGTFERRLPSKQLTFLHNNYRNYRDEFRHIALFLRRRVFHLVIARRRVSTALGSSVFGRFITLFSHGK